MTAPLTYATYLKLDALLDLQVRLSEASEHDEMLFIVIHQVSELWFKQLLHEGDKLVLDLCHERVVIARHTLRRMCTILKTLVQQTDVLETMTPLSFNSFRTKLKTASGFQSHQFRAFEILLGHRRPQVVAAYPEGSAVARMLRERLVRPALFDAFLMLLKRRGHDVPAERDFSQQGQPSAVVQSVLIDIYRHDPDLRAVCEHLIDLDEGVQEWRYRHLQMVQRTIGTKMGTGNSSGADYLRSTLFRPLFPDLWAIRIAL